MTKTFKEQVEEIRAERKAWPLKKKVSVGFRRFKNKLRNTDYLWRNRRRHNRQRIQKGYSNSDLWSFDQYLAGVISKGIIELRDIGHGYPGELYVEGEDEKIAVEKWNTILTEMAEGFELWTHLFDDTMFDGDWKKKQKEMDKKLNRSFVLMKRHFGSLWD